LPMIQRNGVRVGKAILMRMIIIHASAPFGSGARRRETVKPLFIVRRSGA
jgi:hypothetical protein